MNRNILALLVFSLLLGAAGAAPVLEPKPFMIASLGHASPAIELFPVQASAVLSENIVADGSRYYRDAVTGTTGTYVAFPVGGLACSIYNEDETNALFVKFIRHNNIGASEELTAPPDATWVEVQPIPAGETLVFDIRRSVGFVWDRAAGSGAFTVRLID